MAQATPERPVWTVRASQGMIRRVSSQLGHLKAIGQYEFKLANFRIPFFLQIYRTKMGSVFRIHIKGVPKRMGLGFSLISRDGGSEKEKFISCSSLGVLTGIPNGQTDPWLALTPPQATLRCHKLSRLDIYVSIYFYCQAQSQTQQSWTELAVISLLNQTGQSRNSSKM